MHGEQAVVPMFTDLINFNSVISAQFCNNCAVSEETNQHVQYKSVFLDHYYLLKNKKHVSYISKTKSQDFDFFIKVTQLLATMTFRECGIFPLNRKTKNDICISPKFYFIKVSQYTQFQPFCSNLSPESRRSAVSIILDAYYKHGMGNYWVFRPTQSTLSKP